jgi:hypothetical protein
MTEAWWRSLKHQWLFLHSLDNVATIRRLVAFYVHEHNHVLPHSAFRGQTPDEMYFGTGDAVPVDLASRAVTARRARVAANDVDWTQVPESPGVYVIYDNDEVIYVGMRTAQHVPAPLLLARAVLARDQTEIARHLRRPTEARSLIQRGDIRAGGNRTDARQGRQAADDAVRDHVCGKCLIRLGELRIQQLDHAP